jgi:CRP-like cAMP-binding protein
MGSILDDLSTDNPILKELIASLKDKITLKTIPKGTILQMKGEMASKVFYVKKGCLRSYTIDDKGKEHVFLFAPEGWTIGDMESHMLNAPSQLFIDTLENCEIEVYETEFFNNLIAHQPSMGLQGVFKLFKRISVLQKRVIMLMSASAQERYEDFLETYPNIVQRVPQKMVASYLGITPEALSKIRGEMARTK